MYKLLFLVLIVLADGQDLFCKKTIRHENAELFGYAVQLRHSDSDGRVLVGAPQANSTYPELSTIFQPGAVYSCDLGGDCRQYLFNTRVSVVQDADKEYRYKHYKNDGWLGAVIDGSNFYNGTLVTCAPRWQNTYYRKLYMQTGLCYVLDDATEITKESTVLIPLRNTRLTYATVNNVQKFNYIYGEAGMSLHYIQELKRILVGAPGVMDWAGAITESNFPYNDKEMNIQTLYNVDDYSYLGYTVSSGRFTNENISYYVTGAPRSNYLKGEVVVFKIPDGLPEILYQTSGSQMGEFFGASLTVADINGDNFDDIIVGAPSHTPKNGKDYEERGCIYQLISDRHGKFTKTLIDLTKSKLESMKNLTDHSRLGTAMASLGDIDNDGFNDIAVGAPYANKTGMVLIFFGSKRGLDQDKVIFLYPEPNVRTFGISISRGIDLNNNGANDFAVGAHESDHVTIYLTKYKINVDSRLETDYDSFNISTKQITVTSCLRVKEKFKKLTFNMTVYFKDDRFVFEGNNNDEHTLIDNDGQTVYTTFDYTGAYACKYYTIKFKKDVHHHGSTFRINMSYKLIQEKDCSATQPFIENGHKQRTLSFQTGCQNKTCVPKLTLEASLENVTSSLFKLHIKIKNTGDPAFGCQLSIATSDFLKITSTGTCCLSNVENDDFYHCHLVANPLSSNETKSITMDLKVDFEKLKYGKDLSMAVINVTSLGQESPLNISVIHTLNPIEILSFKKAMVPKSIIVVNKTQVVKIIHTLIIKNKEDTPIDKIDLKIYVPQMLKDQIVVNVTNSQVDIYKTVSEKLSETNRFCISNNKNGGSGSKSRKKRKIYEEFDEVTPKSIDLSNQTLNSTYYCNANNSNCFTMICKITERIFNKGYLVVNLTMSADIGKIVDKFDQLGTLIKISTEKHYENVTIITRLEKHIVPAQISGFNMWMGIGIAIGIIATILIVFILYKKGCFKNNYEQLQQAELCTNNDFEAAEVSD